MEAIEKLESAVSVLGADPQLIQSQPTIHIELVSAAQMLSVILAAEGRLDEAEAYGAQVIAGLEQIAEHTEDPWLHQVMLAGARVDQGRLLKERGDNEGALAILTESEREIAALLEMRPNFHQLRFALSTVQTSLGSLLDELGEVELAEAARARSAASVNHLSQADQENLNAKRASANALAAQGKTLAGRGEIGESAAAFRESIATPEVMTKEDPHNPQTRTSLELALMRAAGTLNDSELYVPAESAARRLLELREAVLDGSPNDTNAIDSVSSALYLLVRALEGNGNLEEAITIHARRLRLEQLLAASGTDNRATLSQLNHSIGLSTWRLSRRAEALPYYQRHTELQMALAAEAPHDVDAHDELGHACMNLGELYAITGQGDRAREAFRQCLGVRQNLANAQPDQPYFQTQLAWAEARLALFGDQSPGRWDKINILLRNADAATPLDDWEEELLIVTSIMRVNSPG